MAVTAAQLKIEVSADTADAEAGLIRVDSKVKDTSGNSKLAGKAFMGAGAAVAAGFGLAIGKAADFEAQISGINSVANLNAEQLGKVREKALQLGADTSFSASEAAAGMEELLKAGISYETVMNGGAQAALDMAAATGVDVPMAAQMMSTAVNTFGTDAAEAATLWSQAANASAADAAGLALGIAQVGPVAAAMGLDLSDSVTALALFSQHGLQGSDAGTSFKTMLMSMAAPTDQARQLMNDLGMSFFDANGEFVGLEGAAEQLKTGLAGMTQEQRMATLQTLFGTDAIRAANILYGEGAEGVRAMTDEMAAQGTVQEMAAKRMDNFKGALERMRGSLETAMIIIGSGFLPVLSTLADFIGALIDRFLGLPKAMQQVITFAVALVGGLMFVAGAMTLIGPAAGIAAAGIGLLLSPVVAVVAALALLSAALYVAYSKNILGFGDAVRGLGRKLQSIGDGLRTFAKLVKFSFDMFRGQGQNPAEAALNALSRGMDYAARRVPALSGAFKALSNGFKTAAKWADKLGDEITRGAKIFDQLRKAGLNPVSAALQTVGTMIKDTASNFGPLSGVVSAAGDAFTGAGKAVDGLKGNFQQARQEHGLVIGSFVALGMSVRDLSKELGLTGPAFDAIGNAALGMFDVFGSMGKAAIALLGGDLKGAMSNLGDAWGSLKGVFGQLRSAASEAFSALKTAVSNVDWGGLLSGIGSALSGLASTIWDGISEALSNVDWGGLADTALGLAKAAFDTLGGIADWVLDVGVPAVGGAVLTAFSTLWDWLKSGVSWLAGTLSDLSLPDWGINVPVPGVLGGVIGAFSDLWGWIKDKVSWLSDTITGAKTDWDGGGIDVPSPGAVGDIITGAFSDMWGWIQSKVSWLADTISCGISSFSIDVPSPGAIGDAVKESFGTICDWAKAKVGWLADLGGTVSDKINIDIDAAVSLIGDVANWGGTMIDWIKKHAGWLADLAPKIDVKAAVNAAVSLIGDIANWGGTMLSWLQKHAGWLADLAPKIDVAAIVDGTVTVADSLVSAFDNAISSALGLVKQGANWVWEGGKGILVELGIIGGDSKESKQVAEYENLAGAMEGLQARISAASSAILGNLLNLDTYFQAALTSAQTAATGIDTAWATDVSASFTTTGTNVQTALTGMQTAMGGFVAQATAFGTAAGTGFQTALASGLILANQTVQVSANLMTSKLTAFTASATAQGTAAGNQFRAGLTNGMNAAQAAVTSGANTMRSALTSFAGAAGAAGTQAGNSFRSGVQAGMNTAVSAVHGGVNSIKAAMNFSGYSQGYSGGASFGQGAVNGALAYVGSMHSAGVALASAVVAGFNSVSKPGSPSKTATKQGSVYGQGLYVGASSWAGPLADTGARLADSLSTRVEASFAEATAKGFRLGSIGASGMQNGNGAVDSRQYGSRAADGDRVINQTFNITIDVDNLPDLVEVREFLNGLPRERSLVFGGVS